MGTVSVVTGGVTIWVTSQESGVEGTGQSSGTVSVSKRGERKDLSPKGLVSQKTKNKVK